MSATYDGASRQLTMGEKAAEDFDAERSAYQFQLDFGRNIGISKSEASYLQGLINNPAQLQK